MNIALKCGLLAAGLGLAMSATNVQAATTYHEFDSNAVNYCQAFTPGPANTIRNRVVGSENVGTATINVACNFASMFGEAGATNPTDLYVYFSNNNTAGNVSISCTLLTGYQGDPDIYTVTKVATVAPGTQQSLHWAPADNPTAGATDLGNNIIGVNCSMPKGAVINDTYFYWLQDNGV